MKLPVRKMQRRSRKWHESFTVWIEFIGIRAQIGPLLDHIAEANRAETDR